MQYDLCSLFSICWDNSWRLCLQNECILSKCRNITCPSKHLQSSVNSRNTRKRCEIISTLLIKTPKWRECLYFQLGNISHICLLTLLLILLREKCPYSELFWSAFFRFRTEYGEILHISPYSIWIQENTDQNNSKYGQFLCSVLER